MKIKLYILEADVDFLERITSVFTNKYSNELEISVFTNQQLALDGVNSERVDVLLVSDEFELDHNTIPDRTVLAYLTDSAAIEEVKGKQAISRFQKADLIYKEILALYAESSNVLISSSGDGALVVSFTSTSGGTGTSTMAAAAAMRFATLGKRVIYFDLNPYSDAGLFFQGQGSGTFTDVIYAIKRQKSNLGLKVESVLRQDNSGVFYFEASQNPLDNLSLTHNETVRLVDLFTKLGSFDVVVLDLPFSLDEKHLVYFENSRHIVNVLDGSDIANNYFTRALDAIYVLEDQKKLVYTKKLHVAYNKFSSRNGKRVEANVKTLGGVSRFESAQTKEIAQQIAKQDFFDKLLEE